MNGAGIGRGTLLVHRTGAWAVVRTRKDDDTGWWLVGGGGVADRALDSKNWIVASEDDLRQLFERATR